MLKEDILKYIITPTLKVCDLWSPAAEILIFGTGIIESNYDNIIQIDNPENGGIGFFQMEPSDFKDICTWLRYSQNKRLLESVLSSCYFERMPLDPLVLASNIKLAILMCRVHYLRIKEELPKANDALGMAEYHKKYYNTAKGKADVGRNAEVFEKILNRG